VTSPERPAALPRPRLAHLASIPPPFITFPRIDKPRPSSLPKPYHRTYADRSTRRPPRKSTLPCAGRSPIWLAPFTAPRWSSPVRDSFAIIERTLLYIGQFRMIFLFPFAFDVLALHVTLPSLILDTTIEHRSTVSSPSSHSRLTSRTLRPFIKISYFRTLLYIVHKAARPVTITSEFVSPPFFL